MNPRDLALSQARGRIAVGAALGRALDEPPPAGEVRAPEAALTGHS